MKLGLDEYGLTKCGCDYFWERTMTLLGIRVGIYVRHVIGRHLVRGMLISGWFTEIKSRCDLEIGGLCGEVCREVTIRVH